jgi:hypothetical protein
MSLDITRLDIPRDIESQARIVNMYATLATKYAKLLLNSRDHIHNEAFVRKLKEIQQSMDRLLILAHRS